MTQLSRLAALVAAPVLVAALAPAAVADSSVHRDAAGDVVEMTETGEQPAPEVSDGDITRSVINHGRKRLVFTIVFAGLERPDDFRFFGGPIRTKEGLRREVAVIVSPEAPRGVAFLEKPRGGEVECRGLRHRVDTDEDRVRISVPRRCLDNPRWIRAGVGAARFGEMTTYGDDGRRTGTTAESDLRLSPRLRRG